MWRELLIAIPLAASNFVIHGFGQYTQLPWFVRTFQQNRSLRFMRVLLTLLRFLSVLLTLHFLEVAVWAEFYFLQHCFPDRETAYYFSLKSYTTLGYGDVVISHPWRLMGGQEALTGVLLIGWSTATIATFLIRFREARERKQSTAEP